MTFLFRVRGVDLSPDGFIDALIDHLPKTDFVEHNGRKVFKSNERFVDFLEAFADLCAQIQPPPALVMAMAQSILRYQPALLTTPLFIDMRYANGLNTASMLSDIPKTPSGETVH